MENTKTIMEWLGEKKLYDKKIIKTIKQLHDTPLYVGKPKLYADEKQMQEDMDNAKALLTSYRQLVANRNKIQEAIMKFNATHTITIEDKEFTIAAALSMYQNYDTNLEAVLEKNLTRSINLKRDLEDKQEREVKSLEQQLNAANKQQGKQEVTDKLKARKDDYEPIMKEAIDILAELTKESDFKEKFLQSVNTKINIANVQETLTIDLD